MRILFATDGSEYAATAGRLLAVLPLPAGTPVTVLSAAPDPAWLATGAVGEGAGYPLVAQVLEEEEAAARRTAETAAALLRERGCEVTVCVPRRGPANAILEQARKDGADLIVVGSHGMGAVERFLLGSVSERVARYAHCSVLVARGDSIRRVIVGVDGSESAEHALDALARLPLPAEAEVTALHVVRISDLPFPVPMVPGVNMDSVLSAYDREHRAAGERIVRHAQHRLRAAGRAIATGVRHGAPADELVAAAREAAADLLVVGAENRSALGRLFLGSVSGRVLHHAPCSVLVARSGDAAKADV